MVNGPMLTNYPLWTIRYFLLLKTKVKVAIKQGQNATTLNISLKSFT